MGTRADFYIGKGKDAEWLGSIAWDGYEVSGYIRAAKKPETYRKAVEVFLASRDDATLPAQGWPWPWNNSDTTDCSYWFFDGKTHEAYSLDSGGEAYIPMGEPRDDDGYLVKDATTFDRIEFPDMQHLKKVAGGNRSGLIILSA